MKYFRVVLPLVFALSLAACSPRTTPPPAQEIAYNASADQVFPVVIRAISTAPALEDTNGWIITQSDKAGGFVAAQTVEPGNRFFNVPDQTYGLSVVVSPNSATETAVVTQFSPKAYPLARLISQALESEFGSPAQTVMTPN